MPDSKYLVIGNSAAAVGAVEAIRAIDPEGSLTILSRESEPVYSRPLISYLLGGKVEPAALAYRPAGFYRAMGVEAKLGVSATAIDPAARTVAAYDGQAYGYDRLLIATGGRPIVPPLEGSELAGVFSFTTLADARAIETFITEQGVGSAVVIGGGLIGLKSVEALAARGLKVSVVELAERVLSITLDQAASALAAEALAESGVELITGNTVERIHGRAGVVSGVTLADGRRLDCGLVILAIGVAPDTSLAETAGIATDRGILVDSTMATSAPGIYAAGDVAQASEIISGQKRSIPIWPLAVAQGRVAGAAMAGGDARYPGGLAMNSVEIGGLAFISAGLTTVPEDDGLVQLSRLEPETKTYRKVMLQDGKLVGYVLVGAVERAGILTGLIQSGIQVAELGETLLSDELGLIHLDPDYRARLLAGKGAVA